jgi:hypothetical protein
MDRDNYKQTRTMSKFLFTQISREDGSRHHHLMDGIEPHWGEIRTLVLDSASQFKPKLLLSLDKKSPFYKEVQEV